MIPLDIRQAPERLETIIVETTTWCSLRCAGCARTIKQGLGQWTDQHMTAETFRRIVDHMPPAGSICVQGTGEPTLNPDLPEIVGIAKTSGKYGAIVFSSHGLARDLDYYQRLTDAGLSYFRISVDSFDPIVAERLRSGTVVEKLKERIREFAESGLDFGVSITASTQNLWDIYKTLGALDEIGRINRFTVGIQNFLFQPEVGGSAGPDYSSWVLDDTHTRMLSGEVHGWNQAFANIDIRYASESSSSGEICASPYTAPWVGIDGMWAPCCFNADPAILGFASILEQPFTEAWRSEAPQRYFAGYPIASPPSCEGCPYNCGRMSA